MTIGQRFTGRDANPERGNPSWIWVSVPAIALSVFVWIAGVSRAQDLDRTKAYTPDAAAKRMTMAAGLKVAPFASEPMLAQPVAIEFDDRGRLWTIQYLQYPNPAGLSRLKVDRYSRTIYDRRPEPPPKGPKGSDRITILEDTNGDGVADKSTDFVTGLNLTSGLAFGHGGVFVLQIPYLLFYPDRNRDDVPDSDPEVLLTGFGMEDAHSVANSLTWGPDGWLYGLQGSTVTANIRGIEFQQGIWRYHPITRKFELFAEGGGNMWGLDFDREGRLFASTNVGGFVMLNPVQGGYYWKSFGKHGPLHNPYTFGYFDHIPHEGVRGGHVSTGGTFYQADNLPPEFRGRYLAGNLLSHNVAWHEVRPRGSTFAGKFGGILLESNDPWFAPCDLTVGPDGAVYISDWHDKRTAHPDPDAEWDRSNGRLYRISGPNDKKQDPGLNLHALSTAELVAQVGNRNAWFSRRARRILGERKDASVLPALLARLKSSRDLVEQLELFWSVYASGGFDPAFAASCLKHPNEHIRSWTVRLLGDENAIPESLRTAVIELAKSDPSVTVRLQLSATARRVGAKDGLTIAKTLAQRNLDGSDPFVPLMLWWAVERFATSDRSATLGQFAKPDAWTSPLTREAILGRLIRRFADEATPEGDQSCATLLASAPDRASQDFLISALDQTLNQPRQASQPLRDAIATLWKESPESSARLRLAVRVGLDEASRSARDLGFSGRSTQPIQIVALSLLSEVGDASFLKQWMILAGESNAPALEKIAFQALARFSDPTIAEQLLRVYDSKEKRWRLQVRDVLFRRASWARMFIQAQDARKWDAKEVGLDEVARLAIHRDKELDAMVKARWGAVASATPEEKLAEVRRLNNDLRAAAGDPARGRELFRAQCATCHNLFGEGNAIGPELTHANRKDREFLLVSLVDPSGVVRKEYQAFVVATRDGRVLSGLIVDQTPTSVTLLGAKNERTVLPRSEIEAIQDSSTSLMPEGLYKQFTPAQLRDLFQYLQSDGPVPR